MLAELKLLIYLAFEAGELSGKAKSEQEREIEEWAFAARNAAAARKTCRPTYCEPRLPVSKKTIQSWFNNSKEVLDYCINEITNLAVK